MTLNISSISLPARILEIVRRAPFIDAAALYGSAARGDMEPHSDIDLLIVCSAGKKRAALHAIEPRLSGEFARLSLAIYSPDELLFLNRVQSLFLLHLKREAETLYDSTGFLSTLLSQFREKVSYRSDFAESLALLDLLRARVAAAPNHLHRLSYTYSLFRVFGVYLLAERNIFEFSKSRMAACLSREFPEAREAVSKLSTLRVLNSNFFSGGITCTSLPASNGDDLDDLVGSLSKIVGVPVGVVERRYEEAVGEFVSAAFGHRRANYRLRTWFLLLAYDGINLHLKASGGRPLRSLEPSALEAVISGPAPTAVANAALQALECIREYRAKYFLNEEAKLAGERAVRVLSALAERVSHP